jgi:hypothetical protein
MREAAEVDSKKRWACLPTPGFAAQIVYEMYRQQSFALLLYAEVRWEKLFASLRGSCLLILLSMWLEFSHR